jgi:hypothetical protein
VGALPSRAAIAAIAASAVSLFASGAAARLDGAGLFAPPPGCVTAEHRDRLRERRHPPRRLAAEIRGLVPVLMRFRDLGVTPMILGFHGFGVKLSGGL